MSPETVQSMRIVEIETFGRGGLAHYAHNLSVALAERGNQVSLLTTASYELDDRIELPENLDIVRTLGRAELARGGSMPAAVSSLLRKLTAAWDGYAVAETVRRLDPDLVHFHCTNRIAWLYLSRLERLRCPLAVTAHVVTPHEAIPWQNAIYRRIHRRGDLIIVHSQFDKLRLIDEFEVAEDRVEVIPHGEYGFVEHVGDRVDRGAARRALGLEEDDEVALFFGYIREYKGLDVLLEAWPAVTAARSAARLVVAGDPVQLRLRRRRELEDWAERLGVIHRFGYVPLEDVSRYFAAADVVVMPYRQLSQSGVLYLALSLGVPVIATRVGALSETLEDGETGLLVPPESPEALSGAVLRLFGDAALRERVSRGGLRLAAEHAWPPIAARTERAFERLVRPQRDAS